MNNNRIEEVQDLTTFVAEQRKNVRSTELIVPFEQVVDYSSNQKIINHFGLTVCKNDHIFTNG